MTAFPHRPLAALAVGWALTGTPSLPLVFPRSRMRASAQQLSGQAPLGSPQNFKIQASMTASEQSKKRANWTSTASVQSEQQWTQGNMLAKCWQNCWQNCWQKCWQNWQNVRQAVTTCHTLARVDDRTEPASQDFLPAGHVIEAAWEAINEELALQQSVDLLTTKDAGYSTFVSRR